MAKPGDTVRYLNAVGGGVITRIEGKVAFVDENGFETPTLLKDLVVVLPAGHEPQGAKLMFDQKAFDQGRNPSRPAPQKEAPAAAGPVQSKYVAPAQPKSQPVELTTHGDRLSVAIAFEPTDLKNLSKSSFNMVLVNDSNYTLLYSASRRADGDHMWTLVSSGRLAPNELLDLTRFGLEDLPSFEKIMLQGIALREDAPFEIKNPFSFVRRLDLTKFHKLHCFRPGIYFNSPVMEIQLIDKDSVKGETPSREDRNRLAEKYAAASPANPKQADRKQKPRKENAADNPFKLLPLQEIDLHIGELTDSTAGMQPNDMLQLQLDTVDKTMSAHARRQGQKIVFIHGKGDGVLRKAIWDKLKKEYPKADLQDASFREYGFGATLVTIK